MIITGQSHDSMAIQDMSKGGWNATEQGSAVFRFPWDGPSALEFCHNKLSDLARKPYGLKHRLFGHVAVSFRCFIVAGSCFWVFRLFGSVHFLWAA